MRARTNSTPFTAIRRCQRNTPFRPVPPLPSRCRFQELPCEDHGDGEPSEGSKIPRLLKSKGLEKTIEAIRVRARVLSRYLVIGEKEDDLGDLGVEGLGEPADKGAILIRYVIRHRLEG